MIVYKNMTCINITSIFTLWNNKYLFNLTTQSDTPRIGG